MAWTNNNSSSSAGGGGALKFSQGAVLTPASGTITPTDPLHHVAAGTVTTIATTNFDTSVPNELILIANGNVTITFAGNISGRTTALVANDVVRYVLDGSTWREVVGAAGGAPLRVIPGVSVAPRYIEDLIAIGTGALNPSGYTQSDLGSVAIGYNALASVTTGDDNVAIGSYALQNNTTPSNLTAVGKSALRANTTGTNNSAFGSGALTANTTGTDNVAVGSGAAQNITTGYSNTAINLALYSDVTGTNQVAIGRLALAEAKSGDSNVAVGVEALYSGISADQIVDGNFADAAHPYWTVDSQVPVAYGFGWAAGTGKVQKNADGTGVLYAGQVSSGSWVNYIDYGAGGTYRITYTVSDYSAGQVTCAFGGISDTPRSANGTYTFDVTTIGYPSFLTFTPNIAASRFSISGVSFTLAPSMNQTSSHNVAVGIGAMYQTINGGGNNTAVGHGAMRQHTTGSSNTGIGGEALLQNGSGSQNTALGRFAGYSGNSGSRNVFLGYQAGYYETGNDTLMIDNRQRSNQADARTTALVYGIFDAAVANQLLTVNGNIGAGQAATVGVTRAVFGAGGTGTNAEQIAVDSGSGAAGDARIDLRRNGTHYTYMGLAGGASRLINGDAANELSITNATKINFSADDGTTRHAVIDSSGVTSGTGLIASSGNLKVKTSQIQSFTLAIENVAGTLKHAILGDAANGTGASNYAGKITGASSTQATTPQVAAGVGFTSGGGVDAAQTNSFVFNTAAQTAGDMVGVGVISYNDTGTAINPATGLKSLNVNGTTLTRFVIDFYDNAGASFPLTTASIAAGKSIAVTFMGFLQ